MPSTLRQSMLGAAWLACVWSWASPSAAAEDADAVRAIVAEALRDAHGRSSLQSSADATAGHDGRGFFIRSADQAFSLTIRGQLQLRYFLNFRNDNDNNQDGEREDSFESGFQTRYIKFNFDGSVYDPRLTYTITTNVIRSSGDLNLELAFVGYRWDNGLALQVGQLTLPFARERAVSSAMQLASERSLTESVFGGEYAQGAALTWTGDDARLAAAFSDGQASRNSEFAVPRRSTAQGFLNSTSPRSESDYALTGRAEWKPVGEWAALRDFSSREGSGFAFLAGIAGHVEGGDGASSAFSSGDYRYAGWTADLSLEGDGWNAALAGFGSASDYDDTAEGDVAFSDYGLTAQAGVFVPRTEVEPFVRFEALFPDRDRAQRDAFAAVTLGLNYYLYGHASKLTAQATWFSSDASALIGPRTAQGYLGDDDPNELVLVVQWQLLF